jgi:SpoVK/Ycf46/Vps4 family AAA+-type ATPase
MPVLAAETHTRGLLRNRLTPSQQLAFDKAMAAFASNSIVLVESEAGMGKSSILRAMHRQTGGKFLDAEDILRAHARSEPQEYEQVVYDTIRDAIKGYDIVYFDNVGDYQTASHAGYYHRPEVFDAVFKALYDAVDFAGKKFVVSSNVGGMVAQPGEMIRYRPVTISLQSLRKVDYKHIFIENFDEAAVAAVDFEKVYTFSRSLSGYFLKMVCDLLKVRGLERPATEDVINILKEQLLKSNVDTREVEDVDLDKLVGVDDIVEKLDRTILLPLREPDLAAELGLEPKHGVLL